MSPDILNILNDPFHTIDGDDCALAPEEMQQRSTPSLRWPSKTKKLPGRITPSTMRS